jgi:hypothetical protein
MEKAGTRRVAYSPRLSPPVVQQRPDDSDILEDGTASARRLPTRN